MGKQATKDMKTWKNMGKQGGDSHERKNIYIYILVASSSMIGSPISCAHTTRISLDDPDPQCWLVSGHCWVLLVRVGCWLVSARTALC